MDLGLAGRIRFWGQRSDVPLLLRAADIHCQPNVGPEPFGLTFIEAMAAGLPVVTTAMGAALETVTEECGILVSPDAGQLAAALRTLMSSAPARAALASHAPARARSLCDPAVAMPAIARILNDRVCRSAVICSRSDPDED
jgi:glycosyltransferase involved in cell wall biosynthesis